MENPFACASCKKSFSQPKALHNHVEFYHRSKPLPVTEVSKNMEGMNQSENENCNFGKSPSVRPNHDASRFNSSVQDLPPNILKNTGKDLVKKKRFKKIAWIRSHHLQLQLKFKLLV